LQEHFHYTKQLPQLQRLFERVHKEIKRLYVGFVPTRISQRRNINQQLQPDTILITVCLVGKMLGFISERTWYRFVVANLFPKQFFPDRSRFNRICRQLQGVIQLLRFQFTRKFVNQSSYTIIDSLPLLLCHTARSGRVKRLKEYAGFGYCAAKKERYYGFKGSLHLTDTGFVVGYVISSASVHDVQVTETLLEQSPHPFVLADKGYISESLYHTLQTKGITLWALKRKNSKHPYPKQQRRWIRSRRKQIETLFSGLCDTFRLQQLKPNSLTGYQVAFDAILLAHSLLVYWALLETGSGTRWKNQIFN
jgi:IS5 family transposase